MQVRTRPSRSANGQCMSEPSRYRTLVHHVVIGHTTLLRGAPAIRRATRDSGTELLLVRQAARIVCELGVSVSVPENVQSGVARYLVQIDDQPLRLLNVYTATVQRTWGSGWGESPITGAIGDPVALDQIALCAPNLKPVAAVIYERVADNDASFTISDHHPGARRVGYVVRSVKVPVCLGTAGHNAAAESDGVDAVDRVVLDNVAGGIDQTNTKHSGVSHSVVLDDIFVRILEQADARAAPKLAGG